MIKNISWKPVGFGIFLGLLVTYLLMVGLFAFIGPAQSFNASFFNPLDTFSYIYEDENLSTAFTILPFIIIAAALHVMRYSILKHTYEDASELGIHGTAKWGDPLKLTDGKVLSKNNKYTEIPDDTLNVEPGIIIGKIPDKKKLLIIGENTEITNKNVLVIGSSGSGKGQGFVIPNLINMRKQTIIATDPKGELYDHTAQIKRDQGYKVYHIDFVDLLSAGYNPLDYVKNDFDAINVAGTISRNSAKDNKEDFFFNTAKDLLTGLVIYVTSEEYKSTVTSQPSLSRDVKGIFNQINEDEDFLLELCEEIGHEHPAYQYLKDASAQSGQTRASILSSFAQQTAIFSLHGVAKMTNQSDFNIYDFQKEKSILYIQIPDRSNPLKPLTATFFDQLIDTLYAIARNHPTRALPIHTTFLLDEFANIGKLNNYDETLATCRGKEMSMQTIIQDFAQLEKKDMYGAEQTRTIVNNHDTKLFLRTNDTKTSEYFSNLAGDTTVKHTTGSKQHGTMTKDGSHSSSEQIVKRPLITPGELSNNKGMNAYLFISGYDPLKIEKAFQTNIYGDYVNEYEKYRSKEAKQNDQLDDARGDHDQQTKQQDTNDTSDSESTDSRQVDDDVSLSASELSKLIDNDTEIIQEEEDLDSIKEHISNIENDIDQAEAITNDDENAIQELFDHIHTKINEETNNPPDFADDEDTQQNDNEEANEKDADDHNTEKEDENMQTPDKQIDEIENQMEEMEKDLMEEDNPRQRDNEEKEELPM